MFSWKRNITFGQNKPLKVNGRSTVTLVKEALMTEAIGCST
jgi:hypothetical protein